MNRARTSSFELRRVSVGGQAATLLRDMILSGELKPGTPLKEIPLSESLGVSRNTVRQALRELEHEGLVRHAAHRGAVVASLTKEDVGSIFRARRVLELGAIAAIGDRYREAAAALGEHATAIEEAVRRRDPLLVLEHDVALHAALVDRIGSDRLSAFQRKLLRELRLGLLLVDRRRPALEELASEHHALCRLLDRGETARFHRRLAEHLDRSEQRLLEVVGQTRPRDRNA
jgi:DNA-binding GntR family transcriptional regulator